MKTIDIIYDRVKCIFYDDEEGLGAFSNGILASKKYHEKYGHEGVRELLYGKDGYSYLGEALVDSKKLAIWSNEDE